MPTAKKPPASKPAPPPPPKPAPKPPESKPAPKPPESKPAPKPTPAKPAPKPPSAREAPSKSPARTAAPKPPQRTEDKPQAPRGTAGAPAHKPVKPAPKTPPAKPAAKPPKTRQAPTPVAQTAVYDSDQQRNQQTVVRLCESNHVPELGTIAALCAGRGENDWHTDGCNSSNHCGFWQLAPFWQAKHDYHDVEYWTRYAIQHGFYGHGGLSKIAKDNPNMQPGMVAQLCQGAGPSDAAAAAYYQQFVGEAHAVLAKYSSARPNGTTPAPGAGRLPLPAPAYVNPLADAKVTPSRIDMGCDYAGTGHVACFAACEITDADNNTSGWTPQHPGGYVEYRVTQPGPFEGDYFYVAEGITSHVNRGDRLDAGKWICELRPGWPTGIEMGQAAGSGDQRTWADKFGGGYTEGDCTAAGRAFAELLGRLGETRLPVCQGPKTGEYPRWASGGNMPDLSGAAIGTGGGGAAPAKPSESASKAASSYTWPTDQLQSWSALADGCKAARSVAADLKNYVNGVTYLKATEDKS